MIIGFWLGILVAKLFFKREKSILDQEKKNWSEKLEQFDEVKNELATKKEELNRLREEVSKIEMYWEAKTFTEQESLGNKALYDIFHPEENK